MDIHLSVRHKLVHCVYCQRLSVDFYTVYQYVETLEKRREIFVGILSRLVNPLSKSITEITASRAIGISTICNTKKRKCKILKNTTCPQTISEIVVRTTYKSKK